MATLTIEITEDGSILVGNDSEDMQAEQTEGYEQSPADAEIGMQPAESIGDAVKMVTDWLHENTSSDMEEKPAMEKQDIVSRGKVDPFKVGLMKARGGNKASELPSIKMPGSMG